MIIELPTLDFMAKLYMDLHNLNYEQARKRVEKDNHFFETISNINPISQNILYNDWMKNNKFKGNKCK